MAHEIQWSVVRVGEDAELNIFLPSNKVGDKVIFVTVKTLVTVRVSVSMTDNSPSNTLLT